jgi:NAD(P)-dependent dehydrogenase (short-subunit alcohol dehydrogenase family)
VSVSSRVFISHSRRLANTTTTYFISVRLRLIQLNCTVIIASRSPAKCAATVQQIKSAAPTSRGSLKVIPLDTNDLDKVAAFAKEVQREHDQLHFLVNNAGMSILKIDVEVV